MVLEEVEIKTIINEAKDFFRKNVAERHVINTEKCSSLSEFDVHPFLSLYLAYFLTGNADSKSIAKAMVLPRVLGTSITTSFGTQFQKFCTHVLAGFASVVPGLDIEFIDQIDGRKKYCQVKTGPNTINRDDVDTIDGHFTDIKNLARTNNLSIAYGDLVVGVLRGTEDELSNHYKRVKEKCYYPVYVGQEFWHRLTGSPAFYFDLIEAIAEVALEIDGTDLLETVINRLAKEIEASGIARLGKMDA